MWSKFKVIYFFFFFLGLGKESKKKVGVWFSSWVPTETKGVRLCDLCFYYQNGSLLWQVLIPNPASGCQKMLWTWQKIVPDTQTGAMPYKGQTHTKIWLQMMLECKMCPK